MTWQEDIVTNAERQITWAQSQMPPGQIGGVVARSTCDLGEIPIEMLGDRPPTITDRHRVYEESFNALAELEVRQGNISREVGDRAMANFHVWVSSNRFQAPQTSPHFYD